MSKYLYSTAYGHHFVDGLRFSDGSINVYGKCTDCGRTHEEHLIKAEVTKGDQKEMAFTEKDIAKFSSGAVRSEKAPPWFMMPWEAVRVVLERFNIGAFKKEYGVHNWKKAIGTGDLAFIQQLFDHTFTHMMMFIANVGEWRVETEGKHANETPMDHLAAMGWGVLALITYTMYDRANVQKAFKKWPEFWSTERNLHPPTSEFKLEDNQWVAEGRPEPPSYEQVKAEIDKQIEDATESAKKAVYGTRRI